MAKYEIINGIGIIPEGVTEIESCAFLKESSLRSVIIPNSVTKIGEYAFCGCSSLEFIELSDSVIEIEKYAFSMCSNLRNVILPKCLKRIEECLFWLSTSLECLEIPSGVEIIGEGAFAECSSLRNIDIPNSVTKIDESAFKECSSLESIILPYSVKKIEKYALAQCTNLKNVTLPKYLEAIEEALFWQCTSLESLDIPSGVEKIGNNAFYECSSLKEIEIPDSVAEIEDYAFSCCTSLNIKIFDNNKYFKIKEGVLFSKDGSKLVFFLSSNTVKRYFIPNTVVEIASAAFCYSSTLEYISISDNVKEIKRNAFCTSKLVHSIEVSENNQYFSSEDGILYSKDKSELIRVPIAKDLRDYKIPETVTQIGSHAFCGCSMESIDIPSTVTKLGTSALNFKDINEIHIKIIDIKECIIDDGVIAYDEEDDFDKYVLYVPSGIRWSYRHHPVFGKFKNIKIEKRINWEKITPLIIESDYYGGHEYVDLGLPSGLLWATCNIGASKIEDVGGYYAYGETETKEKYSWDNYKWCKGTSDSITKYCMDSKVGNVDNINELEESDDIAYLKWGTSWRIPSREDFEELLDNCVLTPTIENGVYGHLLVSKLNGNTIFFPKTNIYNDNRSKFYGAYLTRTVRKKSDCSYSVGFDLSGWKWIYYYRRVGVPIRPVLRKK